MRSFSITNGWLGDARHVVSPNQNARPDGIVVDTLVVHGITLPPGRFGHGQIEALFSNRLAAGGHPYYAAIAHLRVSAHALIERTGRITQYVGFDARAWHAGRSAFDGRKAVNDFAVGIELEGTDECPYAPAQYRALAIIAAALIEHYPALTPARILGHSDSAPGRNTDPGPAFDWALFWRYLERACI